MKRFWGVAAAAVLLAAPFEGLQAQTFDKRDLSKEPTLYAVGYAHLDTEWRWEYPQVIDEYLRKTMQDNFSLIEKYPHYVFNFSGANRYRLMKEYYPADFERLKIYVKQGRWFPAGSSMEEGDVNAPSGEALIRQVLYGNKWFKRELGVSSAEYMLPDCFGFPSSLPAILSHSGVKGFSTQKLTWGSGSYVGGPQSLENTPVGTPFNVGVWVGPDGSHVLAALNPGGYGSKIDTDLSQPFPPDPLDTNTVELRRKLQSLMSRRQELRAAGKQLSTEEVRSLGTLRTQLAEAEKTAQDRAARRYQEDWAGRVLGNGKATGLFADYHYFGTGDIGGAPDEQSVKRMEAIMTKGSVSFPVLSAGQGVPAGQGLSLPVTAGTGPVHAISAKADQMFLDITPEQEAHLPRYTGELELINHSAGSLTSQAYQKRWLRQQELLADAAEKTAIAANWLGARQYPQKRLNDAWTLTMGAHFHDLAAGTATPRAYEFAWNDDVIAMNQFAGIIADSTAAVAAGLDTATRGTPIVVFNPLNVARQDVVEAEVDLPAGGAGGVRVTGPGGKVVPSQRVGRKVIFLADVPSVGYAVYGVEAATSGASAAGLHATERGLENEFYRVQVNADGDISSIFEKAAGREILSSPARLAISYDNPAQWPAWNMDWEQERAAPKTYVAGPAQIRIVENGPARVALEVTRNAGKSHFVQTISLSAGDTGKRVEIRNSIDWNTQESNLKATFPLSVSNQSATYNWDIGTIQRLTEDPNKFEVASHQWIDLTDMSGTYGATILTDDKNGSDKPNDNTIRLTLLRTPGTKGGYRDEATQDIGHHDFVYGISGHQGDWRAGQTDWQAQRLNAPLMAFQTKRHAGDLGPVFSLVKVSNPRVRILALKKAENSDEVIVRLVELDGKPQTDVKISFAARVTNAREVNGQEEPVGPATIANNVLLTSFTSYQPRTFALQLARPATAISTKIESQAVSLNYDLASASKDGESSATGFDGKGNSLPAEMLPKEIRFNDVEFRLADGGSGVPNAVVAKGQTVKLPVGRFNRVYILAASSNGDQSGTMKLGAEDAELHVQDWSGFIGQWDDRKWSSKEVSHDNYGEMIGLTPGFIKRDELAWYASHHHDAKGKNVAYSYSYLFAYALDLPPSARTITLPNNQNIRILAISVASMGPYATPAAPLYDELPSKSVRNRSE